MFYSYEIEDDVVRIGFHEILGIGRVGRIVKRRIGRRRGTVRVPGADWLEFRLLPQIGGLLQFAQPLIRVAGSSLCKFITVQSTYLFVSLKTFGVKQTFRHSL